MKSVFAWLDSRTGYKKILHETLFENVPGGARWRYVWGSTLTFTLAVQFITGIFLWMAYSPSSHTAWESVYYIQNEMLGGWLLRGIHHFTAQAMNILLVLHLMQVLIDGAYKAPREMNFWFGLLLLLLVLGLSLTGYLLPWDQKGFWATKVATNIMGITPVIGPQLQQLVLGGAEYGHHTLTRFFALHAGLLPGAIIVLLTAHIYLFRRHGLTPKEPLVRPDAKFFPDQVLKDAVACLAVLAAVLFLVVRPRLFGGAELGAELGAPADASEPYSAARPEWYFLFLFQFLKYFPGKAEVWGAIVIPSLLMLFLFAMPFVGKWKLGHRFNLGFTFAMLIGIGALTFLALAADRRETTYQLAVRSAARDAARVKELAQAIGIPQVGAVSLLRDDAFAQGPKIFAKNCATCHRFDDHDGTGRKLKDLPAASDLKGFASREWLSGLLDPEQVASRKYFGGTKFSEGKMVKFVKRDVAKYTAEEKDQLRMIVAALSAEAQLKSQRVADQSDLEIINKGRDLLKSGSCADCHQFQNKDEDATGPDLTGYGSRDWLIGLITNPGHIRYYGKRNDRMPAFGDDKILDSLSIALVADWLRGDWLEPRPELTSK